MLAPNHQQEIVEGSVVSQAIADLNFWSVTDSSEADKLLNRNNDKCWQHSDNLIPAWAVSGLDPQTEELWLQGVQLKPDTPVQDQDGKTQKYFTASGYETAPLFLDNGQPGYWPEVLSDHSIPLLITEGAKKAGCLLSMGYAAVSIPGVWNGQVRGRLKDSIQQFSGLGRKIYLCFDSDQVSNPKVQKALDRLGRLLAAEGCVVFVVTWETRFKGIDDLCVEAGADAVYQAIAEALTFEEWKESNKSKTGKSQKRPEPATQEDEGNEGRPHFESSANIGLYWVSFEKDEESGEMKRSRTRIGNHLAPLGYLNSPDQDSAGLLLEFQTQRGQIRRWTMPPRSLGVDKGTLIGELLAREYGVVYEQTRKLHRYLVELGTEVTKSYTISDRTGWVDGSFLLPDKTIGEQSIRFRDIEPQKDCPTEVLGTVESWQTSVGKLSTDNSRLIFGIGAALAAPLASLLEVESGGFHLVGATSTGKTTALNVAASVMGLKRLSQWNSTVNGLEAIATAHNHMLLPLDEIGQCNPKDVGQAAYLLGNGQGKQRMTRDLISRKIKQWHLLFLSSGELTLADYLKSAGISQKGGQEVRMPDIPAVPKGGKYGVFESIHGSSSAVEFVTALEMACRENRGAVFVAYLERLIESQKNPDWLPQQRNRLWAIASNLSEDIQDEAISRAAKRFALVQLGLELAHSYGLLPFPVEQCSWAVKTIFTDWIDARGGSGSIEIKQALERIEHEFVTNQFSDRVLNLDNRSDLPTRNLFAYCKKDIFTEELEYWVPSAVFRELCKGVDREALIVEMQRLGWLKAGDAEGKAALLRRVNGKPSRVYVFNQFWFTPKPGVTGVTGVTESQNTSLEGVPGVTPSVTPAIDPVLRCYTPSNSEEARVTPVTPQGNPVLHPIEPQNLYPEGASESVTPVTPVTPQKHESLKTGGQNLDDDEWGTLTEVEIQEFGHEANS